MWDELNTKSGKTPEYLSAIVFFTGDLSHTGIVDWNKVNIKQWIRCYKDLSERYPENKNEMIGRLSMGLVNATIYYGKEAPNSERLEECLQELRELYKKHPEKKVRQSLAFGLVNATNHHGKVLDYVKMEECLQELRELYKKHPKKEVREGLTMSLVNVTKHYVKDGLNSEKMGKCIDEIRKLYKKHPEIEVADKLAGCIVNATVHYGMVLNSEKMEKCIDEIRELYKKHPEKEVRKNLAMGLVNAILHYAEYMPNSEKMEKCIDELRELHEKHPDKQVRQLLAQGLFNATVSNKVVDTEKMDKYIDELRGLYTKYPEKEVREPLAMGLANAINQPIKQSYEYFILLYKLRFDLPDNENKEKVHYIEIMFIEETQNEIQSKYNKNNKSITDFVMNLHLILNDETELVILIDRVAENLPTGIQKILYESLNELGL